MTKVIFDISMSLDGFIAAPDRTPEEPLGTGGQRLHDWAMSDRGHLSEWVTSAGAVICGRRTYDDSLPWWGPDGPSGAARLPVFVLTNRDPGEVPEGGVYRFVTGGIESVLREARQTAGDKNVTVMGGAETGQKFISAGLVDEISVHIVPVMFGGGTRMFERIGDDYIQLEVTGVIDTPEATHLQYRIVK
jgi:dihydrofolate reductase